MKVYIDGAVYNLLPSDSIGQGLEAHVYMIGTDKVAKIYKRPTDADLKNFPEEQKQAAKRLKTHQEKLPALLQLAPSLPQNVITPLELVTDVKAGSIIGYTMKFINNSERLCAYADKNFRAQGVPNNQVIQLFKNLHTTLNGVHNANMVIGDFNDLNVMVANHVDSFIIDSDSSQFGKFICVVFTHKFVDPLLCEATPDNGGIRPTKPHNVNSDWYAYNVMLMRSLLFTDPYLGIYRPTTRSDIPAALRPLHRITVFDSEVKYPGKAIHYGVLPDELLQHFNDTFINDKRTEFPIILLNNIRWTQCVNCGTEHARNVCPNCAHAAPTIKEVIRGNMIMSNIFRTGGTILHAAFQKKDLTWIYHENGQFKRDRDVAVAPGSLDPSLKFRISGDKVVFGKKDKMIVKDEETNVIPIGYVGNLPCFDTNEKYYYWIDNGKLWRNERLGGSKYLGSVLDKQTLFWVGEDFGFGFYRAGDLFQAFTFDAENGGINDNVNIANIRGNLIDANCVFGKKKCWFFTSAQLNGQVVNKCYAINDKGQVVAEAEDVQGKNTWLGGGIRGCCAVNNFLFVPTDNGIVRVEDNSGQIDTTREFPDSNGWVNSGNHLSPAPNGIYVIKRQEILLLQFKS